MFVENDVPFVMHDSEGVEYKKLNPIVLRLG
jgi:hypothetical protein